MSERSRQTDRQYRDKDQLRRAFDDHDGSIVDVARHFDVSPTTIRKWLDRHGIHEPETRPSEILAELEPDACAPTIHDADVDDDRVDTGDGIITDGGFTRYPPNREPSVDVDANRDQLLVNVEAGRAVASFAIPRDASELEIAMLLDEIGRELDHLVDVSGGRR